MRSSITAMLVALAAFVVVTRPDGTQVAISTAWVQSVSPVRANDGSACNAKARSVVMLSGAVVCVVDEAADVWTRLNAAEAKDK